MKYLRLSTPGIVAASVFVTELSQAQTTAPPPAAPAPSAPGVAPAPGAPGPTTAPPEAPPGSVPVAPGAGAPPNSGTNPYYEQAPPPQAPPTIHVEQPPPPPLEPRTRLYHDGFYLRLSLGVGYQGVSSSAGGSKASFNGAGPAGQLLIGGTPATGLVIGGGIAWQSAVSPSATVEGAALPGIDNQPSGGVGLALIGPFIDIYPNPSHGFHIGGLLGLAGIGLKGSDDKLSGGGGGSAWIGYGGWVASQWSLGGLMRVTGAGTKRTVGDVDVSDGGWGLTLEFAATYH